MATSGNRQKLFNTLEKTLREQDKFQSVVLKVSEFGLVQMTRKRSGKTLTQQLTSSCPACKGLGFISSIKTDSFVVLQSIQEDLKKIGKSKEVTISVNPAVFEYLSSVEYNALLALEKENRVKIALLTDPKLNVVHYKLKKK